MPDNKTQPGPPDSKRINVNENHELSYWAKELNVTKDRLIEIVGKVGTSVEAVRNELKK